MNSQEPWSNKSDDQLDPSLGKVVQRISASEPPADLVVRSMDLAKRHLAAERRPSVGRRFWRTTPWLVALAVAATIVSAILLWRLPNHGTGQSEFVQTPQPVPKKRAEPSEADWVQQSPTLWAYHQNALDSSEELDGLLADHASRFRVSGPVMSLSPFGS
jgi:hypothetical protein